MSICQAAASKFVEAIKTVAFHTESTQTRSFMDAGNVYRRLIKDYSKID